MMDHPLLREICVVEYTCMLDMIAEAIENCPEDAWAKREAAPAFWQQAYHALWACDMYAAPDPKAFQIPEFAEENSHKLNDPEARPIARMHLRTYVQDVRSRVGAFIAWADPGAEDHSWLGHTIGYRMIYNLRHTQHHVGVMNDLIARHGGQPAAWRGRHRGFDPEHTVLADVKEG